MSTTVDEFAGFVRFVVEEGKVAGFAVDRTATGAGANTLGVDAARFVGAD